jgi:hypothetical protein
LATRGDQGALRAYDHRGELLWQADIPTQIWGISPAIADLDADGTAEIVYAHQVLSSSGAPLQTLGSVDRMLPLVADIDLDGSADIVTGDAAYTSDGRSMWFSEELAQGVYLAPAIGNFDDDDFAEIVVISKGSLWLLEHDGSPRWGPVPLPGGGRGGAPTVGDFDGDGLPEIAVAGANFYVAFDTDGTILWTSPIQDKSSHRTGSSLFDFDADGRPEVVYADEVTFRIYDGATGTVRYEIGNTSHTVVEMPVVADIDGDDHAEILVVSNGSVKGVRAFEGASDDWAPTRKIWNQHTYHITNVNDDGTVPRHEEPSWLVHNTYRLNTFGDRDPLSVADLSVGQLALIDNGNGQPMSIGARISNGGEVEAAQDVRVAFYQGDPESDGVLLGALGVKDLPAPGYLDVRLDNVALSGTADIHALVDPVDAIEECAEHNNRVSIPYDRTGTQGEVATATDAPSYGPGSPARLSATVTNTGSYPSDYRLDLSIEDPAGNLVATFAQTSLDALPPGGTETLNITWDTGSVLVGGYLLRALLTGASGSALGEATTDFFISSSDGSSASVNTTADRPSYHTNDRVGIMSVVRNLTANRVLAGTRVLVEIRAPTGDVILGDEFPLADLTPGGMRQTELTHVLAQASEGEYQVTTQLLDGDDKLLAATQTTFEVSEDPALALSGTVTVAKPRVQRGEVQSCTENLRYVGTHSLDAQPLRHLSVYLGGDENGGQELEQWDETISLGPGAEHTRVRDVPTTGFALGDYACVLQTGIEGTWTTLGYASYTVTAPPVEIAGSLELGDGARLLVLLDKCPQLLGDGSCVSCGEDGPDSDDDGMDAECHAATERERLETLLDAVGWSYRLVEDGDDFKRELRSGGYGLYLLKNGCVTLEKQIQQELVEAVYNGAGLVVSGNRRARNHYLDEALGVEHRSRISRRVDRRLSGVELTGAEPFPPGQADFWRDTHGLNVKLREAEAVGFYIDRQGFLTDEPAITRYRFGDGRGLYFDFDLLAEATWSGEPDGPFDRLLLTALYHASPHPRGVAPEAVLPVSLSLENLGIATGGRVVLTLPADVSVVDPGAARHEPQDTLTWLFSLDESEQVAFTAWLRLDDGEATVSLDALVQAGQTPDYENHSSLTLDLHPEPLPGLDAARLAMEGNAVYLAPLMYLNLGEKKLAWGFVEGALWNLVRSARALGRIDLPEAAQIRHWVDNAIAEVARSAVRPPRPWQFDRALAVLADDALFETAFSRLQAAGAALDTGDLGTALSYLVLCGDGLEEIDDPRVPELRQWLAEIAAAIEQRGDASR